MHQFNIKLRKILFLYLKISGNVYDGKKADVWSLGVLLYILVTAGFPFPGDSVDKLKRAVLSGQVKIPYWVSVGQSFCISIF